MNNAPPEEENEILSPSQPEKLTEGDLLWEQFMALDELAPEKLDEILSKLRHSQRMSG